MVIKPSVEVVERLIKKMSKPKGSPGSFEMDFSIQRYAGQWDSHKESNLIRSIIMGDPIPPLFIACADNNFTVPQLLIDGKQRVSTVVKFVTKKMKLHKDIPSVFVPLYKKSEDGEIVEPVMSEVQLAGKTFNDLPEDVQDIILEYKFDSKNISDYTKEDIERIMSNLNNGVAMSSIDKSKIAASIPVMNRILSLINNNPLFTSGSIYFAPSQEKKSAYEELILRALVLLTGQEYDDFSYSKLTPAELEKLVKKYSNRWNESTFEGLEVICTALHNVLPEKELYTDYVNKKHFPVLIMNVDKYLSMLENEVITEEEYKSFMCEWFTKGVHSKEFKALVEDDSKNISSKKNIEARIDMMDNALDNFISTGDLGLSYFDEAKENINAEESYIDDATEVPLSDEEVVFYVTEIGASDIELPAYLKFYNQLKKEKRTSQFVDWLEAWSETWDEQYIELIDNFVDDEEHYTKMAERLYCFYIDYYNGNMKTIRENIR